MSTGRTDRLWLVGGAIAAAALLAVSWFFLIGPQRRETANLQSEASTAELHLSSLQHTLAALRQDNAHLADFRAKLAKDRQALPTEAGLSDFLRQLQDAGDTVGVSVTSVTVGTPAETSAAGAQMYALPITLTAEGSATRLSRFLNQLQQVQPRAVLIGTTNVAAAAENGTLAGAVTATLNMKVFVARSSSPSKGG